jgi:hypothetical protein
MTRSCRRGPAAFWQPIYDDVSSMFANVFNTHEFRDGFRRQIIEMLERDIGH